MCSSCVRWCPERLQVTNEDSTSQYEQVYSIQWFPVTPTLNIHILALFSQVSIVAGASGPAGLVLAGPVFKVILELCMRM